LTLKDRPEKAPVGGFPRPRGSFSPNNPAALLNPGIVTHEERITVSAVGVSLGRSTNTFTGDTNVRHISFGRTCYAEILKIADLFDEVVQQYLS
jgi:hypothetical protein